ncbi:TonB-dependent receptor [bacterium]|nr:TonB-dependent receptor [bacterium]
MRPAPSLALIFLLTLLPLGLLAQSSGKIDGTVTDKESGQPLAGCQVRVEGTTLGNITNAKGYFFILNVPPGEHSLGFGYTGYTSARVEGVRVQAGQTITQDASLQQAVIELEALVVEASPEPLVPRDNVQSKQRLDSDFSESMPVERIEDALALKAGVVQNEAGRFSIRGSRLGSEAVYIDGILVRSFSEQPYASDRLSTDNTPLVVGRNSVEEVNVITGGFNAEYGQAESGVINIVSREGGTTYTGAVQLISDAPMPRGSDYGHNELSFEAAGPLPLPGFAGFFLSAEATGLADASPAPSGGQGGFRGVDRRFVDRLNRSLAELGLYDPSSSAARKVGLLDADAIAPGVQELSVNSFADVYWEDRNGDGLPETRVLDPEGVYTSPNPARLPGNSGDLYSTSGKFTWYAHTGLKFLASYMGSRNQRLYYQHANLFNAPERRNAGERVRSSNAIVGLDWTVHQSAERSVGLILRASRYRSKTNGGSLSAGSVNRSAWGGFGLSNLTFIDEGRTALEDAYQVSQGYEPAGDLYPTYNSGYLNPFAATFTPLPGQRGQDNAASPLSLFNQSGLPFRLTNDLEERTVLKADLDFQADRYNRVKTGVEYQAIDTHTRHFFYVGGPLQDLWSASPSLAALYAQDRLDLGDLVLDAGLRADWFDPASDFPTVIGENRPGDPRYSGKRRVRLSPRLEVGFPVTDRSQLRLSYGVFTQTPSLSDIFGLSRRDIQSDLASDNVNNFFGNGRLDIPRTTAFEAGFTWLAGENLYFDFVGYNKDLRGGVAYRWLTPAQLLDLGGVTDRGQTRFGKNLFVATNQDQGNIRGIDLSASRRFSGWWSVSADYSLSFARSTASDPEEFARSYGKQVIRDPLTGRDVNPTPPSQESPTDLDQTHSANVTFSVNVPESFGGNGIAGRVLARSGAFLTWHFNSGRPYSLVNSQGYLATGENNGGRTASVQSANLRLTRSFSLGTGRRLMVFAEIMNLFNALNVAASKVNPTTGQPGVDAYLQGELAQKLNAFTMPPASRSVAAEAAANPGFSSDPAERLTVAQIRDINGDGIVEYPETFALELAGLMAAMEDPTAWLRPREVRFGVRLDF